MKTSSRYWPDRAATAVMTDRSIPTRTVPSWPASTGTPMSMICWIAPVTGSGYAISRICCGASPGTRFLSTMPAGTSGEKVWATSVLCGS